MRKRHTAVGLLCLALLLGGVTGAARAESGLLIEQYSNGLPGMQAEEAVPQILRVGAGAIRLDDRRPGARYVIVRLDEEVIREVDPVLQMYTEQTFADLRSQREEADAEREDERRRAVRRLNGEELEAWLAQRGLRRDGRREVEVTRRSARVEPYQATHHTIAVNGRPSIEVWTTDEIEEYEPPPELFQLYDKVGLFEDAVVEQLRGIEGFPVRTRANIDLYRTGATLETRVIAVMEWPADGTAFEVPRGYDRVDRFPSTRQRAEAQACPVCGEADVPLLERLPPGYDRSKAFCSRECARQYMLDNPRR